MPETVDGKTLYARADVDTAGCLLSELVKIAGGGEFHYVTEAVDCERLYGAADMNGLTCWFGELVNIAGGGECDRIAETVDCKRLNGAPNVNRDSVGAGVEEPQRAARAG